MHIAAFYTCKRIHHDQTKPPEEKAVILFGRQGRHTSKRDRENAAGVQRRRWTIVMAEGDGVKLEAG